MSPCIHGRRGIGGIHSQVVVPGAVAAEHANPVDRLLNESHSTKPSGTGLNVTDQSAGVRLVV